MGLGSVGLQTSQKKEQSGPPFAAGSADNGLSVDAVSGHIVLGNDVGDATTPAILLSNREIPTSDAGGLTGPFAVTLNDLARGAVTTMNGSALTVEENNNLVQASIAAISNGGQGAFIRAVNGNRQIKFSANTVDARAEVGGFVSLAVMSFQQVNPFGIQIGTTSYNSATLQISGSTTFRRFMTSSGANVNINRDLDSGKLFRNSAAITLTLPNMAAANARPGFILRVLCNNVAGVTIQTDTAQLIRFGSLATSTGGTLSSTDVGACVTIVNVDSATWITENFCGAWTLT